MATNDSRQIRNVAKWLKDGLPQEEEFAYPAEVDLRSRDDVVDTFTLTAKTDCEDLAEEIVAAATAEAEAEGRTCTFKLYASSGECDYEYPLRLRRQITGKDDLSAIVAALAKQTAELHESLLKKAEQDHQHIIETLTRYAKLNSTLVDENDHHRTRASDVIDKLESLRSKQLERDMAVEKHKADIDIKERITDAVVPLAMAIGNKFTGGALPAKDIKEVTLSEVVKSLSDHQVETIQVALGDEFWPHFQTIVEHVLEGHAQFLQFKKFVGSLPPDRIYGVIQVLNVGQQAAIQEIIQPSNGAS